MKVLVTGADGFIGSHLAEELVSRGYEVRALCMYNSLGSRGWLDASDLSEDMEILLGDIRDSDQCRQLTYGVSQVFNLAALIGIPYSYTAPKSYIDTNVMGTANLCAAALENGVTRFLQTSTSEVYGTAQYVPIDEKHPLQSQSPYSASKIASDAIALSYRSSFNLPVQVVRPFNTYGPRQSLRAIIPSIIHQILAGVEGIEVGDLRPTRDMNYVKDTVNSIIELSLVDEAVGEVINICSGTEVSIEHLVNMIQIKMQTTLPVVSRSNRLRPESSEVFRLVGDNAKLRSLIPSNLETDLESGLEQTIEWHRSHFSSSKNMGNSYVI